MPVIVSNIVETREVVSVLIEQDKCTVAPHTYTEAELTKAVNDVINYKRLVLGQVVYITSYHGGNDLGKVPAIVTDIVRTSPTLNEYTLRLLAGEITGPVVTLKVSDTGIEKMIAVNGDTVKVLDAIFDSKLGKPTLQDMLSSLGVNKLIYLDNATSKFISRL